MKTLERLFSSEALLKVLKIFFNYPESAFELKSIAKRARISPESAKIEVSLLTSIGFLKKKTFTEQVLKGKKKVFKKLNGYTLNSSFMYLKPLRSLIFSSEPLKKTEIANRFKGVGNIKCLVVSGIFIQDPHSRVDVLIAGDRIKRSNLDQSLKIMEAELGKELNYAVYDTKEFQYRLNVYDKFVRDVFDYPHQVVIDKIGLK